MRINLKDVNMRIIKYYFDCITTNDDVFIGYMATVELGFIKIPTAKKLIRLNQLKSFKIGVKHFVLREAVLEYIKDNTIH